MSAVTSPRRFDRICLGILLVIAVATILVATFKPPSIHYKIFVNAAVAFLAGRDPYGVPFDPNAYYQTLWLYSPTACLFFYPFSYLPAWLGQLLFIGASTGFFFFALFQVIQELSLSKSYRGLGFFFLITSSELLGSIQASKMELLTVACCCYAIILIKQQRLGWAGFFLAGTINFKWQGIPFVGLLILQQLATHGFTRQFFYFVANIAGWVVAWFVVPFTFFKPEFIRDLYRHWAVTLDDSITQTWQGYQSLGVFLKGWVSWPSNPQQLIILGVVIGSLFAMLLFWVTLRRKLTDGQSLLLAVGLGGAFATLGSPMSQSSGYILGTPLLLFLFLYPAAKAQGLSASLLFGVHWFLTSLIYSDLVPRVMREWAWQFNLKPVGFVLLTLYTAWILLRSSNVRDSSS